MKTIKVRNLEIGPDKPLTIIAGPCVAESRDLCMEIAQTLRDRCNELGLQFIFKASFDKANRSSIKSPRGPGMGKGLASLAVVKFDLEVPVTTDIHDPAQAPHAAQVVDLLQIPAFLARQTDLLVSAAEMELPVNVKKGQFMAPAEMSNVITKLTEAGGEDKDIMLTERGTFFGYNRLVNDFAGLGEMMELGYPVCFDATHSTQRPGETTVSGGNPERAPLLAMAAVAAGVQAVFIETHPDPKSAMSDAATMLPLDKTVQLLGRLAKIHAAVNED